MSRVEKLLHGLVPNNLLLTISVTATTTVGKPLSNDDLHKMTQACEAVIQLDEKKKIVRDICHVF
jgi:U4/U6 small nuclear ribonucleoprotein PRP31